MLAALLLASGLVSGDPAAAAAAAQYSCVVEQVSAADRRAVATDLGDRISAYGRACAARFGWDAAQHARACAFALAVIDRWAELYDDWSAAMDAEDAARLRASLRAAGVPDSRIGLFAAEIGQYLAARETIAAIRTGRDLH